MAEMHRSKKQYASAETRCFARQLVDKRTIYQYSALASIKLHSRGGSHKLPLRNNQNFWKQRFQKRTLVHVADSLTSSIYLCYKQIVLSMFCHAVSCVAAMYLT